MEVKHLEIRNFRGIKELSWFIKGNFTCIIGAGDTCKSTILAALDLVLLPRNSITIEDSDFFNQDFESDIVIQVTLGDLEESDAGRLLFQESRFAQFKCGLNEHGPIPEPRSQEDVCLSISLRVDKSLEPNWSVVKGRDEGEEVERKPIYGKERGSLGFSSLTTLSDAHFSWGRNTLLTRLSENNPGNLTAILSDLTRELKQVDLTGKPSVDECNTIAQSIKTEAASAGVNLVTLSPKIDAQRVSLNSGAFCLHEGNVPLRNKGAGSKKLIITAMQMKLFNHKNISVIDELELGLEPHRIRGLIQRLKQTGQQVFTTTHSPVVIRELNVANHELYVCSRDQDGRVRLESLGIVPSIQAQVRVNAEAFLGRRVVVCEGLTEIGCLRAYDTFRHNRGQTAVWSLATSYLHAGGVDNVRPISTKLSALGYKASAFCDNDSPDKLTVDQIRELERGGIKVFQWDPSNSTERQLLLDLPWEVVPNLLTSCCEIHDSIVLNTLLDVVTKDPRVAPMNLSLDLATWNDNRELRLAIADALNVQKILKRIDYSENAFRLALPVLPQTSVLKTRLDEIWTWIQRE